MNHVNIRLLVARVPYLSDIPRFLAAALVWNAQRGVQIFFAVSGFLITSTALRRWDSISGVKVREFYLLRFARIAPLLLLILVLLSILHLGHASHYAVSQKTGGLPRALVAALTFHVNLLEANRGYLPGSWDILWSLSVEEMFYLFFPIVCYLLRNTKAFVILLVSFVMLGPFARTTWAHGSEIWHEYSYLGSMDAIALGCLTALFVSQKKLARSSIQIIAAVGSAILISCLGFSLWSFNLALERIGLAMSILAIGTCLAIVAAAQSQWTAPRVLKPVLSLGQRSYEIYLTHMFIVFAAFDLFLSAGKPIVGVPVLFIAVILAGSILGELVARLYSEPINQAIRRRFRESAHALESQL
jgi:peptidoglycan/LPS O-acetylase OafA/YrhL